MRIEREQDGRSERWSVELDPSVERALALIVLLLIAGASAPLIQVIGDLVR